MRQSFVPLLATALLASLSFAASARADEVTTTTTTHTEAPAEPGVTVGVPGVVGVHVGGDAGAREGCTTRRTTHTDNETGDSVTHKTTDCD